MEKVTELFLSVSVKSVTVLGNKGNPMKDIDQGHKAPAEPDPPPSPKKTSLVFVGSSCRVGHRSYTFGAVIELTDKERASSKKLALVTKDEFKQAGFDNVPRRFWHPGSWALAPDDFFSKLGAIQALAGQS